MTEYWNIVDEVYEFDGRPYFFYLWMYMDEELLQIEE